MNNSNLDTLITDRTAQDVATGTEKGFYNVSDIHRINSYIEYLSDAFGLNLTVENVSLAQPLTLSQINDILNNVKYLRAAGYVSNDTPATPSAFNWNYQKANDVEKIICSISEFFESSKIDKLYSGTFRAGKHIKFRGSQL